jgi:hypothetical protein
VLINRASLGPQVRTSWQAIHVLAGYVTAEVVLGSVMVFEISKFQLGDPLMGHPSGGAA